MNLVDAVVTKVLSEPYLLYNKYWFVDVEYHSYGQVSETNIMCSTEEIAKAIKAGYTFQV